MDILLLLYFFQADCPEKGLNFCWRRCDLHRNYGMVVILSFLCNYDNLSLKLHQGKRSYPDEGWILLADSKLKVY